VSVHALGGWRLIFFVNVPLGIATVIGAVLLMPEVRAPRPPRIDLLGTLIVGVAMLALVYPLIEGREAGWPAWTFASLAAGVVLLVVFAVQQVFRTRAGKDVLVQPSLFRNRGYSSGTLVLFVFFLGMTGVLFVLTLFLQIGEGFSALHAGLTFVPWSLGLAVGAGLSGGLLANRYGRHVLEAGGGVSFLGLLLLIFETRSGVVSTWDIVPGLLVMGFGMGLIVAPLFGTIIAAVRDDEVGSASGVLNAVQQLASAIGVALLGTVFFNALGAGDFHHALGRTLWIDLGLTVLAIALMPLMPMHARPEEDVLFAEEA
jgi:predicted MFS family arabinose efflux permease